MSPIAIASFSFLLIVAGAALGFVLGRRLPANHTESSSKDVVQNAMAMLATMTALVLGLVTASAKSSFDTDDTAIRQTAASLLTIDRYLAGYGAETRPIRDALRDLVADKVNRIWSDSGAEMNTGVASAAGGERIVASLLALKPADDAQHWYRKRALRLLSEVQQARWFIFNGSGGSISPVFLAVLVFWLTVLFGSFGLFAPRNATVIGALLICALSVAGSLFLILEMDMPFGGIMRVSDAPMRYAVSQLGR